MFAKLTIPKYCAFEFFYFTVSSNMAKRVISTMNCLDYFQGGWKGFTMCLSSDGVFSFGMNTSGVLGHEEEHVFPPKLISSITNIQSIACYSFHSVCLDVEGNVYTFGSNEYGQLGVGKDKEVLPFTHEPQKVDIPPCKQISCGYDFTVCLSEKGELYSFGYNECGQLGIGSAIDCNFPQKIELLEDIDFVECGEAFVICKIKNNDVYAWGRNCFGELGTGNSENQSLPFKSSEFPDNIVDIKCGVYHLLVLTSSKEVYTCGWNLFGQCGREDSNSVVEKITNFSDIIRIECGYDHSMFIDSNNNFYVFGHNKYGQLGVGDYWHRYEPTAHPSLSNIIDVSSKGHHVFVKTLSNEIFAFGNSTHLQLGKDTISTEQLIPIQVLQDNEDIWYSPMNISRAKSARK